MERVMASIQRVDKVTKHPNADSLDICQVKGWQVVSSLGEFKEGELAIYCEIDSFLPVRPEFEFLRKSSYKKFGEREGFRLKTVKLRGEISQGLLIPLSVLPHHEKFPGIDEPVSDYLGILKYEKPIPAELLGKLRGEIPYGIPTTSEDRIQNMTLKYDGLKSDHYYVTEKLDGYSATFYYNDGVFGVCMRNWDLIETEGNKFWKVARSLQLEEKLRTFGHNIALQGELIGEGIHGNPYKITGHTVRFYNAYDIGVREYADLNGFKNILYSLELEDYAVPILNENYTLPDTITELLTFADGKSILNTQEDREGLVIRSLDRTISFKVISNEFLIAEKN